MLFCSFGFVPNTDLLRFIAEASGGAYLALNTLVSTGLLKLCMCINSLFRQDFEDVSSYCDDCG